MHAHLSPSLLHSRAHFARVVGITVYVRFDLWARAIHTLPLRIKSPRLQPLLIHIESRSQKTEREKVQLFIQYNMNYWWIGDAFHSFSHIFLLLFYVSCDDRYQMLPQFILFFSISFPFLFCFVLVSFTLAKRKQERTNEMRSHSTNYTHTKTFKLNEIIKKTGEKKHCIKCKVQPSKNEEKMKWERKKM